MHNAVKSQIYPKKSKYISLDWLFDMMYETKVSLSPRLAYSLSYVIRSEHAVILNAWRCYAKQLTSPGV